MKINKIFFVFLILLICLTCIGTISAQDSSDLNLTENNDVEIISDESDCCSDAKTWYVEPDPDNPNQVQAPTVQPAIDKANDGDTIVLNGTFVHCHFTINKNLTITATPGTTLGVCPHHQHPTGSGNYGILYLTENASGSVIEGLGFTNDFYGIGYGQYNPFAVLIDGATDVELRNLTFNWTGSPSNGKNSSDYVFNPIIIKNANNITLSNLFVNNTLNGITIENSSNVRVKNSMVFNSQNTGILIGNASSNIVVVNDEFPIREVRIDPVASRILIAPLNIKVGNSGILQVTLKDNDGNAIANRDVNIIIGGVVKRVTTDNLGIAKFAVKYSAAGSYYVTALFGGDEYYKSSVATGKVSVSKKSAALNVLKKNFKVKAVKKVKVVLKSGNTLISGKKVTVKVNGKVFSAKTNSRGIAFIKVKLTKKGSYKSTLKFAGDGVYKSVSKSVRIVVKK